MGAVIAFGIWLGLRETFFNAPGLIFQSGIGDLYVLMAMAAPGGLLLVVSGGAKDKDNA